MVRGSFEYLAPHARGANDVDPSAVGLNKSSSEMYGKDLHQLTEVEVLNARQAKVAPKLHVNGFELGILPEPTKVVDFFDDDHVAETLYPELEDYLKRVTGAPFVIAAGHVARHAGGLNEATKFQTHVNDGEIEVMG